jgi:hypothetical protein
LRLDYFNTFIVSDEHKLAPRVFWGWFMSKSNWKSWFTFTASRTKRSASSWKFRPQLTVLEGRIAPSSVVHPPVGGPSVGHVNHGNHNGQTDSISGSVIDSQTSTPMSGVTVTLTSTTGVTLTTTTDASGNFSFTGLQAGTYTVTETVTGGDIATASTAGSAGGDASVAGQVSGIVLGSGTNATGYGLTESPFVPA